MGYSYQWSGDFNKAVDSFRKAIKFYPEDYQLKLALARTLSWQGQYQESISIYKEVIKTTNSFKAKEDLSEVYIWAGQLKSSEAILKELLGDKPRDYNLNLLLAKLKLYSGRKEEAKAIFAELSKRKLANGGLDILHGQALLFSGEYKEARAVFESILRKNPNNLEARIYLADTYAYEGFYEKAGVLYTEAIKTKEDVVIRSKLADLLSWEKKYDASIKEYDLALKVKDDQSIRRQKARVLGWARRYDLAIKEYLKALSIGYNENINLEMRAKTAYWNNRINEAIRFYIKLIDNEPANFEALFDLSQIYSYQGSWDKAIKAYQNILNIYPGNFRANDGLEKTMLISESPSLKTAYEFFESESTARDSDIRRHSLINEFSYPINYNLNLEGMYAFRRRSFSDFHDLSENEVKLKLSYLNNDSWRINAFYDLVAFNKAVGPVHQFGSAVKRRILDCGEFGFFYDRERLENNSKVIRDREFRDNYRERFEFDINKRVKAAADYVFSRYSDSNYSHNPGTDLLYYISFEPKRLILRYRFFYQDFDRQVTDYFSPKNFSTNSLGLSWRHYLNKEEVYFGSDDIYYGFGYECSADSLGIVGHKFSAEFNWDISKRLNFNIKGNLVNSSASVYKDRYINASLKYYF